MKSMKKLLSGETTPPILECGEAQLQAALTMEARSRTPLPPSPNSLPLPESMMSSITMELDQKLKLKSQMPDFPVSDKRKMSLEKLTLQTPPKKYTPLVKKTLDDPHYEPVERSYDEIEYRNNAWQTMGIDSPKHTEQVNRFLYF